MAAGGGGGGGASAVRCGALWAGGSSCHVAGLLAQPASSGKPITMPGSGGTSVQCVSVKRGGQGERTK